MSPRSGDHRSKATLYATLSALKRLFIWLAGQPGYKSGISYSDAEYFNVSAKETRVAKAQRDIIRELARPTEPAPQFQEILEQLMRTTQRTAAE